MKFFLFLLVVITHANAIVIDGDYDVHKGFTPDLYTNQNNKILSFLSNDITFCAALCNRNTQCRSIAYEEQTSTCSHYDTSIIDANMIISSSSQVYSKKYSTFNQGCEQLDCDPDIDYLYCDRKYKTCKISAFTGITINMSLIELTSLGFTPIYSYDFGHATIASEIDTIRTGCSATDQLCVGGLDILTSNILLVACGNCLVITNRTEVDVPQAHNGLYWYFTPGYSFGFAPIEVISQNTAETIDGVDRLSWHLDGQGGWRFGLFTDVVSTVYFKLIWKLY